MQNKENHQSSVTNKIEPRHWTKNMRSQTKSLRRTKLLVLQKKKISKTECPSQISEKYKIYYVNVLKARQSETAEETQISFKV